MGRVQPSTTGVCHELNIAADLSVSHGLVLNVAAFSHVLVFVHVQ